MRHYVWDKESNVAGVPASFLLSVKPDFIDDYVIGIIDEYGILLHFETMRSLQKKYKVWSNIPDVVGKEIVNKLVNGYDLQPNGLLEGLDESSRIFLEATMYDVRFDDARNELYGYEVDYSKYYYTEPDCKITTVKNDNDIEKHVNVVLENLSFIDAPLETIYELKIMRRIKEKADILRDQLKDAMFNQDESLVEKYTNELEDLGKSILDMDIDLNISATDVYEYDEFILVKTSDGQTMIIDRIVISSCKHNALSYEKYRDDGKRGPVHFETIYIKLSDAIETELREFDETVYVTY